MNSIGDIDPNQIVAKYISYAELTNDISFLDESFLFELTKVKEASDWKQSFDNLDILRKFNKFHPEELIKISPKLIGFLISNLSNLRSNLTKNALILTKEILTYNTNFLNIITMKQPEVLSDLIPLLYEKGNNDKAFLKNEAKEAIRSFEKNAPLDENILKILLALTQEKNPGISEKATDSLSLIIISKEEEILRKEYGKNIYELLVSILAKLLDSNRMLIKKQGEEILNVLAKDKDFDNALTEFLEKKERDIVNLALDARKKAGCGKSKESLKDFLSKKKQG